MTKSSHGTILLILESPFSESIQSWSAVQHQQRPDIPANVPLQAQTCAAVNQCDESLRGAHAAAAPMLQGPSPGDPQALQRPQMAPRGTGQGEGIPAVPRLNIGWPEQGVVTGITDGVLEMDLGMIGTVQQLQILSIGPPPCAEEEAISLGCQDHNKRKQDFHESSIRKVVARLSVRHPLPPSPSLLTSILFLSQTKADPVIFSFYFAMDLPHF